MMNLLYSTLLLFVFICGGCATNYPLVLRSVDFMSPKVSSQPFTTRLGFATNVFPTTLTNFDDGMSPHLTDQIKIANGEQLAEVTTFLDVGLTLLPNLEIYSIDQGYGVKYQFLGQNLPMSWNGAIKYGTVSVDYSSYNGNMSIDHYAAGNEVGLSLGYSLKSLLPYLSFADRRYKTLTTTETQNQKLNGHHQTIALGLEWTLNKENSSFNSTIIFETSVTHAIWPNVDVFLPPVHGTQFRFVF